jgi:peptide-methionine (R)-S-oxide reductase
MKKATLILIILSTVFGSCTSQQKQIKKDSMEIKSTNPVYSRKDTSKVNISDTEWKKALPADVYNIARQKGTERAFTGKFWEHKDAGTY